MKKRRNVRTKKSGYSRANFLRRLREACGTRSMEELESLTGINRETIRRQLRGMNRPTVDQAARVCETFGASADWLLFGRGRRPRA